MTIRFSVALIINPFSGLGGPLALKGTDQLAEQALKMGAVSRSAERAEASLLAAKKVWSDIDWFSIDGEMGGSLLDKLQIDWTPLMDPVCYPTGAEDTRRAAAAALAQGVELLLFAGGDGTARDICAEIGIKIPVLGIPAGVKIHSGVFAVTPHAAGEVLVLIAGGGLVDIREKEVKDINEDAFRNDQVIARWYGDMRVPDHGEFIQHTKIGGIEDPRLVTNDIADYLIELMESDTLYLVGSGKSTAMIMENMALDYTLLGIDAIKNDQLVKSDLNENQLLALVKSEKNIKLIISVIGGQGHILGRGNQQLSPDVLTGVGRENIIVIATKSKLRQLSGRPLILDTGNRQLDSSWSGLWEIITGYDDRVLYPVRTY